jgi:hypothetical protein
VLVLNIIFLFSSPHRYRRRTNRNSTSKMKMKALLVLTATFVVRCTSTSTSEVENPSPGNAYLVQGKEKQSALISSSKPPGSGIRGKPKISGSSSSSSLRNTSRGLGGELGSFFALDLADFRVSLSFYVGFVPSSFWTEIPLFRP